MGRVAGATRSPPIKSDSLQREFSRRANGAGIAPGVPVRPRFHCGSSAEGSGVVFIGPRHGKGFLFNYTAQIRLKDTWHSASDRPLGPTLHSWRGYHSFQET